MRNATITAVLAVLMVLKAPTILAESEQSSIRITPEDSAAVDNLDLHKAAQWGLNVEEWKRYRSLMQGPMGVHSPNLDPLTALGIEARNEQELDRYAELQAQMETARITKLLAYQNAYDRAYKRLYPNSFPVNPLADSDKLQSSPAEAGDRLALFVTAGCESCAALIKTMQRNRQRFDVYLVGSRGNDDKLRAWALEAGVEPAQVHSRQITLNHDAGRWANLGLQGDFPAVLRHIQGKWVRQ